MTRSNAWPWVQNRQSIAQPWSQGPETIVKTRSSWMTSKQNLYPSTALRWTSPFAFYQERNKKKYYTRESNFWNSSKRFFAQSSQIFWNLRMSRLRWEASLTYTWEKTKQFRVNTTLRVNTNIWDRGITSYPSGMMYWIREGENIIYIRRNIRECI